MRLCTYTMYIMVVIWIIHDYNKLQLSYTQVCDLFLSNFGETIIQPGRIKNNKCIRSRYVDMNIEMLLIDT
mgnify:CR=1 FL=1